MQGSVRARTLEPLQLETFRICHDPENDNVLRPVTVEDGDYWHDAVVEF